jgi:hypothetical protein
MFGHHKARRQKKRLGRQQEELNKQRIDWEQKGPGRDKEAMDYQAKMVNEKASQSAADREAARQAGRKDTEEFFKKDIQGLDPEKRKALQYEANKGIQRGVQSANRKLLGEQSQHGIVGRGGVGYAQQRDLQRLGQEAQGQANRDLTKLDKDLALKKLAAIYTGGEGHAATAGLDKQMALDELQLAEEKKRQRNFEDQFYKNYNNQFTRA